jgi:hypothetical protein
VGPLIVTTISPVPLGFVRYQNSASLLWKDSTLSVSWRPPNVTETTSFLFAWTPTRRSLLLPVPTLKFVSVIWYGDEDAEPEVASTPFSTIPEEVTVVVVRVVVTVEVIVLVTVVVVGVSVIVTV